MRAPLPLTIMGGSPPTARKARTGEFTPPGKNCSARCCRACERSSFLEAGTVLAGAFAISAAPQLDFATLHDSKKMPRAGVIAAARLRQLHSCATIGQLECRSPGHTLLTPRPPRPDC